MTKRRAPRRGVTSSWQPVRTAVRCTCGEPAQCPGWITAPSLALFWPVQPGVLRRVLSQACALRLYGFEPARSVTFAGHAPVDVRARQAGD